MGVFFAAIVSKVTPLLLEGVCLDKATLKRQKKNGTPQAVFISGAFVLVVRFCQLNRTDPGVLGTFNS